jgi:hypothetical protein
MNKCRPCRLLILSVFYTLSWRKLASIDVYLGGQCWTTCCFQLNIGCTCSFGQSREDRRHKQSTTDIRHDRGACTLAPASWMSYALHLPIAWYHEGLPLRWSPVSSPRFSTSCDISCKSSIDPAIRLYHIYPPTVCNSSIPR